MARSQSQFSIYVEEEVKKYRGVIVPVKAGVMELMFKRKAKASQLHPNPDDEFCLSSIGPNYQIISGYEEQFKKRIFHGNNPWYGEDPLVVEKITPDGYMILNGHHRWMAAMRMGLKRIPIKIVNLSQETDIKTMLKNSSHNKRAAFDLDEVIFCPKNEPYAERPLRIPFSLMYNERIRLGVPAMFHLLSSCGYDIWVFTAEYYSIEYIRAFFKKYHVYVNGIVTGTARKTAKAGGFSRKTNELLKEKYEITLTVDRESVVFVDHRNKEHQKYDLDASDEEWSSSVMAAVKDLEKDLRKR